MTVVKVCGMRTMEHMTLAAEAGADLLGMVFLPTVRRYIPPEDAAALASEFREQGFKPKLVGLFADQPLEHVNAVARQVGLDLVQLCGSEPLEYMRQVEPLVIKVVHVPVSPSGDTDDRYGVVVTVEEQLQGINDAGHIALLDRQSSVQPGGTGQTFDWSVAREVAESGHRFILAGGLTPENVGEAIKAVEPWGVDVSTGVETDGVKDEKKIRRFVAAALKGATV
ncbi:MAG: phosphoribosylanthranilate isomerase [Chloroflexota bacterium]|nr:phosphoribosylanthranilate isomerase [Chloroflexota bacterium]MDE2969208.1 phosphoribosylanthranilate isomerase [Chloroflexota bacterium]